MVELETVSQVGHVIFFNSALASLRNAIIFFIQTPLRRYLSGQEGIEPSLTVLETAVLPLNYCPE